MATMSHNKSHVSLGRGERASYSVQAPSLPTRSRSHEFSFPSKSLAILGGALLGVAAGTAADVVLTASFPEQAHAFLNLYQFDMSHGAPLSFIGAPEAVPFVLPVVGGIVGGKLASR